MSKINQIQNALRSLGDAAFQKLADAYLHKRGYERINPIGSAIGADKVRKGTPDTLITLPNGKYVFAEHTTQKKGVREKFKVDLNKCFDEKKTGIPVSKIEEIVFCHTSLLTSNEEESLREECQKHGLNVNIFGIGSISYDLHQKYPGIARDFLGIEVDTGQIVTPDEFIAAYNKNAIATPLNTVFHFRELELEQVLQGLKDSNLVIISGKAGVGKSRFVLEVCAQFVISHSEYLVRCIFLRGSADLFEDLRVHFSEPGKYLIFVDDANRINRFEYFIQLLHDQREDQQIKVIATVRDYALDKVIEAARSYKNLIELELKPFEEEQIKQFVEDEYGIANPFYLDRIADISQGNPRLAVMISDVAKRENTFKSIINVSSLYDEYYRSIRQDLEELGDENLLKTAGIVAFFRIVDYSNEEMIAGIELAFGITKNVFWQAACELHDLELLDMYENEIVRTSDQVLANYLFYLAFFVKRVLNFSTLLESFFPRLQYRLVDALNPVLNAFDRQKVIEIMRPQVDQTWIAYKNAGDETSLMHLMEVFWFLKETEILLYVHDYISKMEPEVVDISTLEIKPNSHLSSPSVLTTLGLFIHSNQSHFRMALDLLLKYLAKLPKELPKVLHLLTDRFGFKHNSYVYEFVVQRAVIDVLGEQIQEGRNELFSKLFLAVAEQYLQTHFSTSGMKGRRTVNILNFDLPPTEELFQLRRTIWQGIFQLYQMPIFKDSVLDLLHKYSTSGYKVNVIDIIKQDASQVLPFIESVIETNSYSNCLVVQDYLGHLEDHQVLFDQQLRDRFTNQTYALSKVLLFDRAERRKSHLNYEEYEKSKRQQIVEYFASYSFSAYEQFFDQCLEIQKETNRQNHNDFHFPSRIVEVLIALAHRDSALYIEVMKHYLLLGNPFHINDLRPVSKLIKICGVKETYRVLHEHDYPLKWRWLFDFYRLLPQEEMKVEYLEQLYSLYRESTSNEIPHDLDFLLRYCSLDEYVVARVTEIFLKRSTEENLSFFHILSFLFNEYTDINKNLIGLFKDHLSLLKQAYLATLKADSHTDYDMKNFANILDTDSNFILEYIDWIYKQKEESHRFDSGRDYSFAWKRDDYEELMNLVIAYTYKHEKDCSFSFYSCIEKFFILEADDKGNEFLWKRQDHLLSELIEDQHQDLEFMQFIFDIVMTFSYERRRQLTAVFLNYNKNFEVFEKIPLEPSFCSWEGSAVPMYQRRIEYLESLLPLFNAVDFLRHRQYVEQYIHSYREAVEQEKKKDFMED